MNKAPVILLTVAAGLGLLFLFKRKASSAGSGVSIGSLSNAPEISTNGISDETVRSFLDKLGSVGDLFSSSKPSTSTTTGSSGAIAIPTVIGGKPSYWQVPWDVIQYVFGAPAPTIGTPTSYPIFIPPQPTKP